MNQIFYSYRNMGLRGGSSLPLPLCDLASREKVSKLIILNIRLRPAEETETQLRPGSWQQLNSPSEKCSLEPWDLPTPEACYSLCKALH